MNILEKNPFIQNPKVVVFDLCGTLMNSKKIDHDAINYTLSCYKKDCWEITRLKKDKSKSMKDNFPIFFGDKAKEAYDTYMGYLLGNMQNIPFFENASEHLQLLKKYDIKTAIITNRDAEFVQYLCKNREFKFNINPYIDTIVSADDVGITKPSSKIIDFTLKKLSLFPLTSKQDIIFVGDAYADMQVAINYPALPILLTATTADITEDFLKRNYKNIYEAKSHEEIITSFKIFQELNNTRNLLQSLSERITEKQDKEKINVYSSRQREDYTILDIIHSIHKSKIIGK